MTQPLTPERILQAAEEVLRRHGPQKANVVDVARALGVSHGAVYRHFASKQALREAVTERWLHQFHTRLAPIDELKPWLLTLFEAKRRQAFDDPELFATYQALCNEHAQVVDKHVETLIGQLTKILGDAEIARTVFQATTLFHHPAHAAAWNDPFAIEDLHRLIELLITVEELDR